MIDFQNIDLTFNTKKIFDQFSLSIATGEKAVVLGKSGLGKSSLFHLLLGFIRPQAGEIRIDNVPINEETVWPLRQRIAYVDQDTNIGAGQVLNRIRAIFAFKANMTGKFSLKELEELFDYFELTREDLTKDIEDLSGGEKQRVALIIAILLKRDIFLLDEITSGLDTPLKEKVVNFFIEKKSCTVIVISHDTVWMNHPQIKIFDLKERAWKP